MKPTCPEETYGRHCNIILTPLQALEEADADLQKRLNIKVSGTTMPINLSNKTYLDIDPEPEQDFSYDDNPVRYKERTRLPRKFDKQNKRKKNKLAKQSRRKNRN